MCGLAAPDSRAAALRIVDLQFSADGSRLLTSFVSDGKEIKQLWDTATGKQVGGPIRDPQGRPLYSRWNFDGSRFVTFVDERKKVTQVQMWDAKTGTTVGSPMPNEGESGFPLFSDASGFLATFTGGKVSKWDPVTGRRLAQTRDKEHIEKLLTLAFGQDHDVSGGTFPGRILTIAPGVTRIVNYAQRPPLGAGILFIADGTGTRLATIPGVISYRTPPENKRLLMCVVSEKTLGGGATLSTWQMYDLRTGKRLGTPIATSGTLSLSPDGTRFIEEQLPEQKHCCVLWSVAETRAMARLPADRLRHGEYQFSRDGKYIATVTGADLMLWSAATGKKLFSTRISGAGLK